MKQKLLRPIATVLVLALLASPALAWEKSGEYSEGMVLVTEGDKWGYANSSGTLAISPRFDEAEPFYNRRHFQLNMWQMYVSSNESLKV